MNDEQKDIILAQMDGLSHMEFCILLAFLV